MFGIPSVCILQLWLHFLRHMHQPGVTCVCKHSNNKTARFNYKALCEIFIIISLNTAEIDIFTFYSSAVSYVTRGAWAMMFFTNNIVKVMCFMFCFVRNVDFCNKSKLKHSINLYHVIYWSQIIKY